MMKRQLYFTADTFPQIKESTMVLEAIEETN